MQSKVTFITLAILGVIFLSSQSQQTVGNVAGPPAGNTGSPFDGQSCARAGCHVTTASNLAGLITSNIPGGGYIPGNTYTINATMTDGAISRFGFQISPQRPNGALGGTIIATNTTTTQVIGSGKYITHKTAGTSGTGTKTWSFDWVAPTTGTGIVTFYGAFNFANNNGTSSGDQIRLSNLQVSEDITMGLNELIAGHHAVIYPTFTQGTIHIKTHQSITNNVIQIRNILGVLVYTNKLDANTTSNETTLQLPPALKTGVYLVSITDGVSRSVTRIVMQ